jgi:hypothetical protein
MKLVCMTNLDTSSSSTASTLSRQLDDFEAAQRAALVVENFDISWLPESELLKRATCTIWNSGATVATSVSISQSNGGGIGTGRSVRRHGGIAFDLPIPVSSLPNPSDGGGLSIGPGQRVDCGWQRELSSGDDEWNKKIRAGEWTDYFVVSVSYRDVFGRAWISNDCRIYQPWMQSFGACVMKPEGQSEK